MMGYDALIARLYGSDASTSETSTTTNSKQSEAFPVKKITTTSAFITYWDTMQEAKAPDLQEVQMKQFENRISNLSPVEIEIYLKLLQKRKAELVQSV